MSTDGSQMPKHSIGMCLTSMFVATNQKIVQPKYGSFDDQSTTTDWQ